MKSVDIGNLPYTCIWLLYAYICISRSVIGGGGGGGGGSEEAVII